MILPLGKNAVRALIVALIMFPDPVGPPTCRDTAYRCRMLMPAKSFEDIFANLERFRLANLRLNPKKCELFRQKLKYCGVYLTPDGVLVDEERTAAV
eukprot:sb/3479072/